MESVQRQRHRKLLAAAPIPHPSSSSSSSPPVSRARSSLSRRSALRPTPPPVSSPPADRRPANYASQKQDNVADFCKYLHESGDPGLPNAIHVNYNQLMALGGLDLTIATCNDRQFRQEEWIKPAGKKFIKEKRFGDENLTSTSISFYFSDFPKSMQKLPDYLSDGALVETVSLFGGNLSLHSPTARGRHLLQMLVAALFENYSKGIFLNGAFDIAEIVIFNYGSCSQRIEILLQKPAEAHNWTKRMCDEAKIKDMLRVAELIMLLYMKDGLSPLYFHDLIGDLQKVTCKQFEQPSFREYLCYHVAFMHSNGRKHLETMLHSIYTNCRGIYIPFMQAKPTVYPYDWRTRVNKVGTDDIGHVLNGVYSYTSDPNKVHQRDPYDESVRALMKFKRNVFEHGGQHIVDMKACHLWHLELCAAYMFREFLPSLVYALLESGLMETTFAEAWEGFKHQGLR